MVEIRSLKPAQDLPLRGEGWILIEKKADLWLVRGRAKDAIAEAVLSASGFDSAEIAIRSAEAWADLLTADVIYVREGP